MKFHSFILVVILASGTSLTVLAESNPASAQNSTISDASTFPAATSAQATISKSQRTPSTDPPSASHAGRLTGSVLGVDPHARIITVKMDHSVDGIHTGDQIHIDKTTAMHKTARHRPIHRKTRTAPTGTARRPLAPTVAPGETATPPARGSSALNIAPSGSSSSVEANSGVTTLSPAPSPTVAPPQSTPGESAAPTASEIPPEIGLVPRRSGGYIPGGSTPGGL